MTQRFEDIDLDTQPEVDQPPYRLLSLSVGLLIGCGLILGALLGGLAGHFLLNDAFGFDHDILYGAIAGAIIVAIIAVASVKLLSGRMESRYDRRSASTH
jgi:hypothetical protein